MQILHLPLSAPITRIANQVVIRPTTQPRNETLIELPDLLDDHRCDKYRRWVSTGSKAQPRVTLCSATRRLLSSAPAACLTTFSQTATSLPVVGSHLQPVADAAALGAWMSRQAPAFLSQLSPQQRRRRHAPRRYSHSDTVDACAASLAGIPAPAETWPPARRMPPLVEMADQRELFLQRTAVPYGDDPGQVLDIWRSANTRETPAPVLVFVPGGAWLYGKARYQGHALLSHLAARGWLCLAVDYRVSPRHRWPRHMLDVKAAIAWARANAAAHGGDPRFVAVAGASAGGHLAALAALSGDDPEFNAELGGADATVDAAVSLYGRYDWEDRSTTERDQFMGFLEHLVVRKTQRAHPEVFRAASPLARIASSAPPFFVVHGTADSVIPVAQAHAFVEHLRAESHSPVGYLELPGAQHAFDLFDGARTGPVCVAVAAFLEAMYLRHTASIAV